MKKHKRLIIISVFFIFTFFYSAFCVLRHVGIMDNAKYEELISTHSDRAGVDRLLVKAVMKRESNMNPGAVSSKGAVGLMQIMPKTAQEIAGQIGMPDYKEEMLKEPELNIMFGVFYLGKLLSYYNSNLLLALAAYNAGIGNVDKWISQNPAVAVKISKIPFKETRKHTKAIIITYNFYKGADKLKRLLKIKTA
jgi:Soluble lytic murein transglycosylase and related regulatory proteins (some contain LysM/invasin domains)